MGLSHYPSAAEGMLPVLVMNTVISVAILKSMVRWVLQAMGCVQTSQELEEDGLYVPSNEGYPLQEENSRDRKRISVTLFKSLCKKNGSKSITRTTSSGCWCPVECCVCLHGFQADEEVSELSCKHFFHKGCLEKWLDHKHSTCPLCRSTF